MQIGALHNIIPFRLGMIATPGCPAGRQALYYRDRQGQHYVIQPLEYLRIKILRQPTKPSIRMLGTPQYYRQLMERKCGACFTGLGFLGSFPGNIKLLILREHQAAFAQLIKKGQWEFIWDQTDQIHILQLETEAKTGTARYCYRQGVSATSREDFILQLMGRQ